MADLREGLRRAQQTLEAKRVALGIGSRDEHARAAIRRRGARVQCSDAECAARYRVRTNSRRRLRDIPCPECGGRLRPAGWFLDPVLSRE